VQPTNGAQAAVIAAGYQTAAAIAVCNNDPVDGVSHAVLHRHPSRPYAEATFTYELPSLTNNPLVLCYRFGSEPYQVYPTMTINAIAPIISSVSLDVVVQGLSNAIFFGGTTGVTSGDAAK